MRQVTSRNLCHGPVLTEFPRIKTQDLEREQRWNSRGEGIKIPQDLSSCRCYYTLLQRPCSQGRCRTEKVQRGDFSRPLCHFRQVMFYKARPFKFCNKTKVTTFEGNVTIAKSLHIPQGFKLLMFRRAVFTLCAATGIIWPGFSKMLLYKTLSSRQNSTHAFARFYRQRVSVE